MYLVCFGSIYTHNSLLCLKLFCRCLKHISSHTRSNQKNSLRSHLHTFRTSTSKKEKREKKTKQEKITSCDAGFAIAYISSMRSVSHDSLCCMQGKKQTKRIQRKNVNIPDSIVYTLQATVKVRSGCVLCHLAKTTA